MTDVFNALWSNTQQIVKQSADVISNKLTTTETQNKNNVEYVNINNSVPVLTESKRILNDEKVCKNECNNNINCIGYVHNNNLNQCYTLDSVPQTYNKENGSTVYIKTVDKIEKFETDSDFADSISSWNNAFLLVIIILLLIVLFGNKISKKLENLSTINSLSSESIKL